MRSKAERGRARKGRRGDCRLGPYELLPLTTDAKPRFALEAVIPDFSFLDSDEESGAIRINTYRRGKATRPPARQRREPPKALGCLVLMLLVGGCVVVVSRQPQQTAEQFAAADNRLLALNLAQAHIKNLLKAPASAKWPSMFDGDRRQFVEKLDDGTYMVTSFVDAQNTFGAMLRTWYTVHLDVKQSGTAIILSSRLHE